MSSPKALPVVSMVLLGGCAPAAHRETPDLGRIVTPAEIAGWDISIPPDGTGLNARTLPRVKMPNHDGFIPVYPAAK
jgi:hypothetical protein